MTTVTLPRPAVLPSHPIGAPAKVRAVLVRNARGEVRGYEPGRVTDLLGTENGRLIARFQPASGAPASTIYYDDYREWDTPPASLCRLCGQEGRHEH